MPYYSNLINLPNQNLVKGNALQDNQIGTIDTSISDVTKATNTVTRCELQNSNDGSANGDAVNNTAGTNPVKSILGSPVTQVSLQKPVLSLAYPARAVQPTF